MERIAIAGISLHDTDVGSLERVARPRDGEHSRFLLDLADDLAASEVVLLATCNRVEVIFARETGHFPGRPDLGVIADYLGLPEADPLRARLRLWTGRDAARHLFRVASSLDSVVLGEDQIIAQVRAGFALSEERSACEGDSAQVVRACLDHMTQTFASSESTACLVQLAYCAGDWMCAAREEGLSQVG